eukprot:2798548-Rhodomonas_salina.3
MRFLRRLNRGAPSLSDALWIIPVMGHMIFGLCGPEQTRSTFRTLTKSLWVEVLGGWVPVSNIPPLLNNGACSLQAHIGFVLGLAIAANAARAQFSFNATFGGDAFSIPGNIAKVEYGSNRVPKVCCSNCGHLPAFAADQQSCCSHAVNLSVEHSNLVTGARG